MLKKKMKRFESGRLGSALIMTVVLTVMLSIVAVMFVLAARMDLAATSNIADNKMLDSAARSVIEIINKELILDTPGVAVPTQEYYDYPDAYNAWLASIEPYLYDDKGTPDTNDDIYYWRQISDVTGFIGDKFGRQADVNVSVKPSGSTVIKDYPDIKLDPNGSLQEQSADADGDGIADSKWFELEGLRTSKGKPIYAAVRIIDNSAMVNINTAYRFDANSSDANKIDGTSQMQINLANLLKTGDSIDNLHNARCGTAPSDQNSYSKNVIWRYGLPDGNYLPFDISDELELRYRYCIDGKIKARIEKPVVLPKTIRGAGNPDFGSLYDTSTEANESNNPCASNWRLRDWQRRIALPDDCKADRRHLLTSLSLDRVIDPCGTKMVNVNTADVNALYSSIRRGLLDANSGYTDVNKIAAQIAVNIIDYRDNDSNVAVYHNPDNDSNFYGFERPCVYISELAYRKDPCSNDRSYAVELYKPYAEDDDASNWKLIIRNPDSNVPITYSSPNKQFHVIRWQNPGTTVPLNNMDPCSSDQLINNVPVSTVIFDANSTVLLTRNVGGNDIVVDSVNVPAGLVADGNHSFQRDITQAKCIRRLWGPNTTVSGVPILGSMNDYNTAGDLNFIQAHPANCDFNNIGQIGMIFRKGAYYKDGNSNADVIGYNGVNNTESQVRLNLANPDFQQIFKYLTVMDPNNFHPDDPNYANETRIKGRININTAPAYVLAQLPWVSLRKNDYSYNDPNLAKAIIAYRDKSGSDPNYNYAGRPDPCGFRSIGELCNVNLGSDPNFGINYYGRDDIDQARFPDLDPNDRAVDDFEERDLIFARISDLVTVRSDMFTAYILVRIGVDGPQKRYMVILDRSGVKTLTDPNNNRVFVRAFQFVPEAR
jgi:hypothetical protein